MSCNRALRLAIEWTTSKRGLGNFDEADTDVKR